MHFWTCLPCQIQVASTSNSCTDVKKRFLLLGNQCTHKLRKWYNCVKCSWRLPASYQCMNVAFHPSSVQIVTIPTLWSLGRQHLPLCFLAQRLAVFYFGSRSLWIGMSCFYARIEEVYLMFCDRNLSNASVWHGVVLFQWIFVVFLIDSLLKLEAFIMKSRKSTVLALTIPFGRCTDFLAKLLGSTQKNRPDLTFAIPLAKRTRGCLQKFSCSSRSTNLLSENRIVTDVLVAGLTAPSQEIRKLFKEHAETDYR